jgi:hypothetical protein
MLNTETRMVFQMNVRGNVEINYTQGIGPVLVVNEERVVAWVEQREDRAVIHFAKFFIY